jgi:hypothetical protein
MQFVKGVLPDQADECEAVVTAALAIGKASIFASISLHFSMFALHNHARSGRERYVPAR